MIHAFFDESHVPGGTPGLRDGKGILVIAGVAFDPVDAEKFADRWLGHFGGTPCHATDLNSGKRSFYGISTVERERV